MDITVPKGKRKAFQRLETRALILESAKALFADKGFERTTVRAIAASSEVGLGTIFKHFEDKNALLAAALHDDLAATLERAFKEVKHEKTARENFIHIASRLYQYYAVNPSLSKTLVQQAMFSKGKCQTVLDEQLSDFIGVIDGLLEKGKEKQEIKQSADNRAVAFNFFSHYIITLVSCLNQPTFSPESALAQLEEQLDITYSGIETTPGSKR
ncbi:MAG: TetR/AcrR family transcriptional regulator [Desulfobacterium sp.]|nr:TetR/AcrR family transcriptional regulator [Desulfobacterium sp.]